jgi:hypothetical protein
MRRGVSDLWRNFEVGIAANHGFHTLDEVIACNEAVRGPDEVSPSAGDDDRELVQRASEDLDAMRADPEYREVVVRDRESFIDMSAAKVMLTLGEERFAVPAQGVCARCTDGPMCRVVLEFGRATTSAEIDAVQRLRYLVYVEEMDRYHHVVGGEAGRFVEPEDAHSRVFYARDGSEVVAATRMTCGVDGFSRRQIDQYQLAPFLAELPHELMGVGERNTVLASYRGSGALSGLLAYCGEVLAALDLRVVFGCCEPHLLSMYLKMGQRTYARHNINSPTAGYLIPLVSFVPDVDALRGVGGATPHGGLPLCVEAVLALGPSVRSEALSAGDEYWNEIRRTLDEIDAQQISAFDGFADDETRRCVAKSTIIECEAGDRVLKRGGTARNIFVVLDGTLEVRDGEQIVNVLRAGDAFGEIAFLLERPRSFDVDAVTDGTRILSLSESALRTMIASDPTIAAKLLLNLAKMLCIRVVRAP